MKNLAHTWNLSAFYTVWVLVELIFVYFFYVETRGPTLEELVKIFDGDEAAVAHLSMAQIEKETFEEEEKNAVTTQEQAVNKA